MAPYSLFGIVQDFEVLRSQINFERNVIYTL